MTEITQNSVDILQYLVEHNFDVDCLQDVKDDIYIDLYTKNYNLQIDANIADCIVKYQKLISTTYCLAKYGTTDLRKISLDERQKLCLKFNIREGSTGYCAQIKEIIKMAISSLPERHRLWGLIILAVALSGSIGGYLYYRYAEERLHQQTIIEKEETTRLAIEKLVEISESGNVLAHRALEYAMNNEKDTIKSLQQSKSDVVINGQSYSAKQIDKIAEDYSKRISIKQQPQSKNIKGRYTVTSIETKSPYRLTLQNKDGKITPNYNPELLNIDIIKEIQASMAKSAPVDFDFEINVFTNEHGVETMEVIDIQ